MNRLLAIAILFAAPLLAQSAAAQDCLCLVGEEGFALMDGFELIDAETPDTTIESVAFVGGGSDATADAGSGAPAHRTVLWCASSNDPRCQPMQPSDVPTPSALSSSPVGATVAALTRFSRRFAIEMTMTPSLGLTPSTGVRSSLDRPPR
jgi:hypothetical protein